MQILNFVVTSSLTINTKIVLSEEASMDYGVLIKLNFYDT